MLLKKIWSPDIFEFLYHSIQNDNLCYNFTIVKNVELEATTLFDFQIYLKI